MPTDAVDQRGIGGTVAATAVLRRALVLALVVVSIAAVDAAQAVADTNGAASPTGWVLEFGPYVGYYDFDALTYFEDHGLFGARAGVHLGPWARAEAEFDEVYTARSRSGTRARQISFAAHLRAEPSRWVVAPSVVGGLAFVALDDSDLADAFGEAWDLGVGARYAATARWVIRVDYVLRRQKMRLFRPTEDGQLIAVGDEEQTLWGRSLRAAVAYVF
jgi:hypothetical protein